MFQKLVCCRNGDCTDFVKSKNGKPELIVAFKHQHNLIAFFDSQGFKIVCGAAGFLLDIAEGKAAFGAVIGNVEHCKFIRLFSSKDIDNVVCKVKVFFVFKGDFGAKTVFVFFGGNKFIINTLGIIGTMRSVWHNGCLVGGSFFLRSENDCVKMAVGSANGYHSVRGGAVEIDAVTFMKNLGMFTVLYFKAAVYNKVKFLTFVRSKRNRAVFGFFAVFVYYKKRFGNPVAEVGSHVVINHAVCLFDFLSLAGTGNGVSAKFRALAFDDIGDINAKA